MCLPPVMHFTLHAPSAGSHIVAHLKVIEKDKHAIKNFGARPLPAPALSPGIWVPTAYLWSTMHAPRCPA